ncbi:MAG TPA: DNA polymerase IV [Patescibacteria group bacterium]|nr:DNA polymerase IV [Patescibacteria group bacterium]
MNSFFASCEQQANPQLRSKPVGVCEHLGGIIIAPSIEAKRFGIKTAMPVWDARKLCPGIQLTRVNAQLYIDISRKFFKLLRDYSNNVEEYSIDEGFVDLTSVARVRKKFKPLDAFMEAAAVVLEIKQRMKREVGDYMRCSVGISYNRLLAKVAGEMVKPDGLTILRPGEEDAVYNTHKLTDIPGIAHRLKKRLTVFGVRTLRDLKSVPRSHLVSVYGLPGLHIYNLGHLQDDACLPASEMPKSVGHVYSVPKDGRTAGNLSALIMKLSERLGSRLHHKQVDGQGVFLHVHDMEENCYKHAAKSAERVWSGWEVYKEAIAICRAKFPKVLEPGFVARRVGVTVFGTAPHVTQLSLFPKSQARKDLQAAVQKVSSKHGRGALTFATTKAAAYEFRDSVGFRRKLNSFE